MTKSFGKASKQSHAYLCTLMLYKARISHSSRTGVQGTAAGSEQIQGQNTGQAENGLRAALLGGTWGCWWVKTEGFMIEQ